MNLLFPSASVVAERLCFQRRLSFCPQGGWGVQPLVRSPGHTHPGQTPPGQTPSLADNHCSGRYASYWNAFLFAFNFENGNFRYPHMRIIHIFKNISVSLGEDFNNSSGFADGIIRVTLKSPMCRRPERGSRNMIAHPSVSYRPACSDATVIYGWGHFVKMLGNLYSKWKNRMKCQ